MLLIKRLLSMMLLLVVNIIPKVNKMVVTYGGGVVFILPFKLGRSE
jgi:hypothetical protein